MTDHSTKPHKKAQWLPLFDDRTKEFLANQNYKRGAKFLAVAVSSLLLSTGHAHASDIQRPLGLPTANTSHSSFALPTANTNSLDPWNVPRTGASAAFPTKNRDIYFDHRTQTLREAAPLYRQNDPARANIVIGRDRRPNYFNGSSGIPTDFSR